MVQWFRGGSEGSSEVPPPPGGTGGSGFGGVGGAPAGPEPHPSAGERRDATFAGRAPRRPATAGGTPAPDAGASHRAGTSASGASSSGRRGLPRLSATAASTPEERRFSQVYAEDRVGPMPYPNQASPDIAEARARVRALVEDLLPNGVDEGTGGALDPLIASWASGWLARIDSEHADHHAVVDRLVGGARQQLADAEAAHERDQLALEIARRDYADARERLMDPVPDARSSEVRSSEVRSSEVRSSGVRSSGGGARGGAGEPDRRGADAGSERPWLDRVGRPGRSHDLDHDHGRSTESDAERRRLGDRVVDRLRSPLDDPEPPRADDDPRDRGDRPGGGWHRSDPRTGAPDPATGPYPTTPPSYGTTAIPPSAPERPGGDR